MGHPLRHFSITLYALLAGVAGGYQHVLFVLPARMPRATTSPLWFGLPQARPSRSTGAFMWLPSWRVTATAQTAASPRHERRRSIFMWLFTSIRNVAGLPVRVSVAAARAMRSMCLYLRRPWSARYDTENRSLPGSRGPAAGLAPNLAQRAARARRIKTLVRLDSEGVFLSITKCALPPPSFTPVLLFPRLRHARELTRLSFSRALRPPGALPLPAPLRRWHPCLPLLAHPCAVQAAAYRPGKAGRRPHTYQLHYRA